VGMHCSLGSFEHLRVPVARITFLHVTKRRSPDSSRCGYPDRSSSYSSGFVFARDSEGFFPAALPQAVEPCTHQAYQIATAFLPIVVWFLKLSAELCLCTGIPCSSRDPASVRASFFCFPDEIYISSGRNQRESPRVVAGKSLSRPRDFRRGTKTVDRSAINFQSRINLASMTFEPKIPH